MTFAWLAAVQPACQMLCFGYDIIVNAAARAGLVNIFGLSDYQLRVYLTKLAFKGVALIACLKLLCALIRFHFNIA